MKKTITFNDIVAFVTKAMAEDMQVMEIYQSISVIAPDEKRITFHLFDAEDKIEVLSSFGDYLVDVTLQEIHKFQVLCDKVNEYSTDKTIEMFYGFFNEDNSPKDINDLDDE